MNWTPMIFWIVVALAALVIDITTSSFMFIWFAVGAMAAIIAIGLSASIIVQAIVFVAVSAVVMAVGYPIVKKTIKKTVKKTLTMEEGYVGKEFTITKDIDEKANIKFQGIYWTVKNVGKPLKKGESVQVIGIEGNKLLITKV
ncbi:NfeD family protein [Clostridium sp. CM028]|uniref:NfeD family protein n=1 Tax=unclassified Clostridium TaxID=2614128 RepID=UPI001C6EE4DC|nr:MULTISPECIES: NfeD family protein [unclassified Clostridium]MBW9145347.1 NfeD family protein [Clostridium sp. CM027]MBW9148838.1 NfeD family protein [Clostridium sp. CM028]UVE42486.1 NfeD family protein [Clostridium sp. CM027]WLC63059.1 NfeD family protein [Clostridium sp. CM028]